MAEKEEEADTTSKPENEEDVVFAYKKIKREKFLLKLQEIETFFRRDHLITERQVFPCECSGSCSYFYVYHASRNALNKLLDKYRVLYQKYRSLFEEEEVEMLDFQQSYECLTTANTQPLSDEDMFPLHENETSVVANAFQIQLSLRPWIVQVFMRFVYMLSGFFFAYQPCKCRICGYRSQLYKYRIAFNELQKEYSTLMDSYLQLYWSVEYKSRGDKTKLVALSEKNLSCYNADRNMFRNAFSLL